MALIGFIDDFTCPDHGRFRKYARVGEPVPCPVCKADASRVDHGRRTQGLDYNQPILSQSAGIHPDQIPEAKRLFPHHEFAPDGRMIFRNHRDRERALKDIGLYDKN